MTHNKTNSYIDTLLHEFIFTKIAKIPLLFFQTFVHMDIAVTPSLPSVDNHGHLLNPLPPPLVHVVIECPPT